MKATSPRSTPYRIASLHEEGDCLHCGYPLYTGDRAYMTDDDRAPYCSRDCARQDTEDPQD